MQIKKEVIVDREAFESGQFRADGGFVRFNKVFEGKLETILQDFHEAIWNESA